ncbi:MAG: hypothetical protein IT579_05210 [Verrucomicrobia subdivision 3 bacterium]|nr:hypothetical protein [Limisphaerales bacterium]
MTSPIPLRHDRPSFLGRRVRISLRYFAALVFIPQLVLSIGLLIARHVEWVYLVITIPLVVYCAPVALLFGDTHFMTHATLCPADLTGWALVVAFYGVTALVIATLHIRIARRRGNAEQALQRRPAVQSDGSGNLSATVAADRAFPAALAGSLGYMTRHRILLALRPVVSVLLAILAWVASMSFTLLFPEVQGGKFLSDRGFFIAAPLFLCFLLLIAFLLRLRWWDALAPAIIPILIIADPPSSYWAIRVWLAFIAPFAVSACFAELLHWRRRQLVADTTAQT